MIIAYENKVLNSTITAFIESPALPMDTALKDKRLSRVGRLLGDNNQYIVFDFGQPEAISIVTIFGHNFTDSAIVHIQGNDTDIWTSPIFDELVTTTSAITHRFTETNLQYWRITIDDPGNPDTYLDIGGIFLGNFYTAPGILPDHVVSILTNSESQFSPGGQIFTNRGVDYWLFSITFPTLTTQQRKEMENIFSVVNITEPFYIILYEDDPTDIESKYVVLTSNFEFQKISQPGGLYSASATIREVK